MRTEEWEELLRPPAGTNEARTPTGYIAPLLHRDYRNSPILRAAHRLMFGMAAAAKDWEQLKPWFDSERYGGSRQAITSLIQVVDAESLAKAGVWQCPICVLKYVPVKISVSPDGGEWWKTPNVPVSLKCGHIHCGSCTFHWFAEDFKTTCPTCRDPFDIFLGFIPTEEVTRTIESLALEWQAHLLNGRCCTVPLNSSYNRAFDDKGRPRPWSVDQVLRNINTSKKHRKEVAEDQRWVELVATVVFGLTALDRSNPNHQNRQWLRARRLLSGLRGHLPLIFMPGKSRNRLMLELEGLLAYRGMEGSCNRIMRSAYSNGLTDMLYRMVILFETTNAVP